VVVVAAAVLMGGEVGDGRQTFVPDFGLHAVRRSVQVLAGHARGRSVDFVEGRINW